MKKKNLWNWAAVWPCQLYKTTENMKWAVYRKSAGRCKPIARTKLLWDAAGKKKKKKNLKPTYCSALSWMKPKCSAYRYQSACWFTQHAHTPGRNFCWDFCLYTVATGRPGWANVRQRQSETFSWAPYQLLLVNNQSSDSDWGCKIEPLFHENQTSPLVAADILTDLCYHHH